jgi:hypothetical protein
MNTIQQFCEDRMITKRIEDAFIVYCRSVYADKFRIWKQGDTARLLVDKMTRGQVEELWQEFVIEMKRYLTE